MKHWKLIVVAILLMTTALSSPLFGEEKTGWIKTLDLTLSVTQSSYSDNWTGGDQGNATWIAQTNGIFERQFSPRFNSKTTIKLAFGQTHTQYEDENTETGAVTYKWDKPVKSTDDIDIESVGRFTLGKFVDPYAALRFESKFFDASVEHHKRYLNPILVTLSSGIVKNLWQRPEKDALISRFGLAIRETISKDIPDPDIYETETNTAIDAGLESVTDFSIVFNESVGLLSELSLFRALFNSEKDDLKGLPEEDYWKAIDVSFENSLTVSVAKHLQVSLHAQLLYDKEIDLGGRFKETLSLGLTYKLL
jgi:hypothetical protein